MPTTIPPSTLDLKIKTLKIDKQRFKRVSERCGDGLCNPPRL